MGAEHTTASSGGTAETLLGRRLQAARRDWLLAAGTAMMDGVSRGLRRLPDRRRYLPADAITAAITVMWSRRLPVIAQNFASALGLPAGHPRVQYLTRASIRNYGRMAVDFLMVRTMTSDEVLRWVAPVHAEYLDEALHAGRGAILVLPHAGSWDVAAAFAQSYGYQLNVVTEGSWAAELVAGSRQAGGVTLIPRDRSLRPLFRALARNQCVVMLADIAHDEIQAVAVPFFGRPAPLPAGPARLSEHTGAPILVISCVRLHDGSYRIEAYRPLRAEAGMATEKAVTALTAAIAADFERVIAASPEQWYPFHRVWPD